MARSGKYLYYCTSDGAKCCVPLYTNTDCFSCVPNSTTISVKQDGNTYYTMAAKQVYSGSDTSLRLGDKYVLNCIRYFSGYNTYLYFQCFTCSNLDVYAVNFPGLTCYIYYSLECYLASSSQPSVFDVNRDPNDFRFNYTGYLYSEQGNVSGNNFLKVFSGPSTSYSPDNYGYTLKISSGGIYMQSHDTARVDLKIFYSSPNMCRYRYMEIL